MVNASIQLAQFASTPPTLQLDEETQPKQRSRQVIFSAAAMSQ